MGGGGIVRARARIYLSKAKEGNMPHGKATKELIKLEGAEAAEGAELDLSRTLRAYVA